MTKIRMMLMRPVQVMRPVRILILILMQRSIRLITNHQLPMIVTNIRMNTDFQIVSFYDLFCEYFSLFAIDKGYYMS